MPRQLLGWRWCRLQQRMFRKAPTSGTTDNFAIGSTDRCRAFINDFCCLYLSSHTCCRVGLTQIIYIPLFAWLFLKLIKKYKYYCRRNAILFTNLYNAACCLYFQFNYIKAGHAMSSSRAGRLNAFFYFKLTCSWNSQFGPSFRRRRFRPSCKTFGGLNRKLIS